MPAFSSQPKAEKRHPLESIKWVLQGRWFGHPLHPLLAHLPTALWPTALVLDIISRTSGDHPALTLTAWWCILAGLAAALLAVPTGLADWSDIKPNKPARKIGIFHLALNGIVFLLFLANFILRGINGIDAPRATLPQLVLSAIGAALLVLSGYLGGLMIYDHGIHVAKDSKKHWRQVAQLAGANLPPE